MPDCERRPNFYRHLERRLIDVVLHFSPLSRARLCLCTGIDGQGSKEANAKSKGADEENFAVLIFATQSFNIRLSSARPQRCTQAKEYTHDKPYKVAGYDWFHHFFILLFAYLVLTRAGRNK